MREGREGGGGERGIVELGVIYKHAYIYMYRP